MLHLFKFTNVFNEWKDCKLSQKILNNALVEIDETLKRFSKISSVQEDSAAVSAVKAANDITS